MSTIYQFTGPYRFLSNFFIEPDGTCVEIEYQQSKCLHKGDMSAFTSLTPGQAKRLGRRIELRPDWESVKLDIMHNLVLQKFRDHPTLATHLLSTGLVILIEGNDWGDAFWGVTQNGHGRGENHLGRILMKVREEL
jgi:ribA/ribD-fused uncharacterized protein